MVSDAEQSECEFSEAVAALNEAFADLKHGRTLPIDEAFDLLREKHGPTCTKREPPGSLNPKP